MKVVEESTVCKRRKEVSDLFRSYRDPRAGSRTTTDVRSRPSTCRGGNEIGSGGTVGGNGTER